MLFSAIIGMGCLIVGALFHVASGSDRISGRCNTAKHQADRQGDAQMQQNGSPVEQQAVLECNGRIFRFGNSIIALCGDIGVF